MPTAGIVGRVVTARGEAVSDARILVSVVDGTTQRDLRVDREGRFVLGPMAPARLRLAVLAAGHPHYALADVDLLADSTRDLGDIRLPAPARITVRTRLPSGVDPAGLRVALAHGTAPAQAGGFIAPPAGGTFASEPLSAGDYIVHVLGTRTHPVARAVRLREGQEVDLDVELEAARPITLALTFSEEGARNGIAHGLLGILDRDGAVLVHEKLWSPFDDFTARLVRRDFALRPGEHTVEATDYGGRHERRVVTIGDDPVPTTITFDLR